MSDFLKELFETYYKEQKKQDEIKLIEKEIGFLKAVLDFGYHIDYSKVNELMKQKENELKELKGE